MERTILFERVFVGICFAVMVAVTALILHDWSRSRRVEESRAPVAPKPAEHPRLTVYGKLIDVPGFTPRPSILGRTRVSLWVGDQRVGEETVPEDDGRFRLEERVPPGSPPCGA